MATDVAFSLGALALVASSASLRLRVFLMTLGVADDILSILVLVTFYSAEVGAGFIAAGLVCLVVMFVVRTFPDPLGAVALLLAAVAWWTFARGGVEAAVVGVALGLGGLASTGPTARRGLGPRAWEHRVNPGVNLVVLPVFAIANAGVDLAHLDLASSVALRVFVAVLVARVVGKPLGVWLGATLAPSRFVSPSDERPPTRLRLGLGTVASVGFTVSLLITRVAFGEGALADAATAALLLGTVIGLVLTSALLRPTREG
jgi:NhaA family Na+:H+ antiporter